MSEKDIFIPTNLENKIAYPKTNMAESPQILSQLIEHIFKLTLRKDIPAKSLPKVLMEEASQIFAPTTDFDLKILEQVLFDRIMLPNPEEYVVPKDCSGDISSVVQKQVVTYLGSCYICWHQERHKLSAVSSCKIRELIFRNFITALTQPMIFENQLVYDDFQQVLLSSGGILLDFINDLIFEIMTNDASGCDLRDTLNTMFHPVFNNLREDFQKSSLLSVSLQQLDFLHTCAGNSDLAFSLLNNTTPRDGASGAEWGGSILGCLISLSSVPSREGARYEFFTNPTRTSSSIISSEESSVWTAIQMVVGKVHTLFYILLKTSPESKHLLLTWIARCMQANQGRGKLWNMHMGGMNSGSYISDGFMLNLTAVLLGLCRPFCEKPDSNKLLKVDPTYCAAMALTEEQAKSRGVHLNMQMGATCLIPTVPEGGVRRVTETFTFMSECFFYAHTAMDLGFRVVQSRFGRLSQELSRLRHVYQDTQQQNRDANVTQTLESTMEQGTVQFLCIKTALTEPKSLELYLQLVVSTCSWLVQVALNTQEGTVMPATFAPVTFPLPDTAPQHLACIPEMVVENVAEFLVFLRRHNGNYFEEQGHLLEPILTFLLVFMGSPQRMRNPHLRARLAECLECLLPPNDPDEQPSSLFGSFHRERLFTQHPHRLQIVPILLHVFVSIEMTGQSVSFEQKFNYRRPMYVIMQYLWNLQEQQNSFSALSVEAEAHIEASDAPLFLRFSNLLMNDAIFLLDEALSYMSQLRDTHAARDAGSWANLTNDERTQNESNLMHMEMIARYHNALGKDTIHTLHMLTSKIQSLFTHPTLVDRIASMLNYFLLHLVGPQKKNFKVRDMDKYEFKPGEIVTDICGIYVHLQHSAKFCTAVASDGRSYSPELFSQAETVLARIGSVSLVPALQEVATRVESAATKAKRDEELLAEAPDEFLDPIMSTLMRDPVVLPSSKITLDRTTIARHLLSDQTDPFNRNPLSMDMVETNIELRGRIEKWVETQLNISDKSETSKQ